MRQTLLLLISAMLAAGCGKKPAPASAKPPPAEENKDAKPGEGAADEDSEAMPRSTSSDPCEGGEDK
jgi:hypothetical protein